MIDEIGRIEKNKVGCLLGKTEQLEKINVKQKNNGVHLEKTTQFKSHVMLTEKLEAYLA